MSYGKTLSLSNYFLSIPEPSAIPLVSSKYRGLVYFFVIATFNSKIRDKLSGVPLIRSGLINLGIVERPLIKFSICP